MKKNKKVVATKKEEINVENHSSQIKEEKVVENKLVKENKKDIVSPKKNGNLKTILVYSVASVLVVSLGITAGIVIKREFTEAQIDYTGFNPENYRMDAASLVKAYDKNPNKEFTPAELINIGLEKYRQCENCYSIGVGTASTIVNQTIRNAQIKVGNHYFEESISYSRMVAIANRVHQIDKNQNITLNKGKATSSDSPSYKDNIVSYTSEDYKNNWGKTLDEMFIYLINNQTVINEESHIEKKDDRIIVTVKLDPNISTYYYKIQMKSISNLDNLPTFESLIHTYTFDKDMVLKHCKVDEKYQATMGVPANIHNIINYYYHANEKLEIPNIDERIDYSIEGEEKYE